MAAPRTWVSALQIASAFLLLVQAALASQHTQPRVNIKSISAFSSSPSLLLCQDINISQGTATCGGNPINIKDFMCGQDGEAPCEANSYNKDTNVHTSYHFVGAGMGVNGSYLPPACANKTNTSGIGMVQYLPKQNKCTVVGLLSTATYNYTASQDGTLESVVVDFGAVSHGTNLSSFATIKCSNNTESGFTVLPLTPVTSFSVNATAPCFGAHPPTPPPTSKARFVCVNGDCLKTSGPNGVSHQLCESACVAPKSGLYECRLNNCQLVPDGVDRGVNFSVCEKICQPIFPPHHHHVPPPTPSSASPTSTDTPWLWAVGGVVVMIPVTALWIRYWVRKNIGKQVYNPPPQVQASLTANVYE